MTIAVKRLAHLDSSKSFYGYDDFEIYIDGECDGNYYRQNANEKSFHKLYGVRGNWGKAIRGNIRETAQRLVDNVIASDLPFSIAVID